MAIHGGHHNAVGQRTPHEETKANILRPVRSATPNFTGQFPTQTSKSVQYLPGYPSNIFGFTNGHDVMLRKAYSKLRATYIKDHASGTVVAPLVLLNDNMTSLRP